MLFESFFDEFLSICFLRWRGVIKCLKNREFWGCNVEFVVFDTYFLGVLKKERKQIFIFVFVGF